MQTVVTSEYSGEQSKGFAVWQRFQARMRLFSRIYFVYLFTQSFYPDGFGADALAADQLAELCWLNFAGRTVLATESATLMLSSWKHKLHSLAKPWYWG